MPYDLDKLKPTQAAQLLKRYKELRSQLELLHAAQGYLAKLLEDNADPGSLQFFCTLIGMIKFRVEQLHSTVVMWITKTKV